MWQFYLDKQHGGATAILENEKLLLEHPLPADVTLWMTGLECWPTGYDFTSSLFAYRVPVESQPVVTNWLEANLNVTIES